MIRFIIDTAKDAPFNMAADRFLLDQCSTSSTVTIRFYQWITPSITMGYMQEPADVLELEKLKADNFCWIKRPTGGRAVLHFEDITYSCVFPNSLHALGESVQQSYHILTECLIEGFSKLGIQCQAHDSYDQLREVKREVKLPCFLAPNRDEIMVNGRKLVGSAQRRTTSGVLQHGSIPLSDFYCKLPEYLKISDKEREIQLKLLQRKSICLNELLPDIEIGIVIEALQSGFIEKLKLPGYSSTWSNEELESIGKIQHEFLS